MADRETTGGRIDPSQFSREELFNALCQARVVIADQQQQIAMHCVSAHWRNGEVDTKTAARTMQMTEDQFKLMQSKVDEEARRFIMEADPKSAPAG